MIVSARLAPGIGGLALLAWLAGCAAPAGAGPQAAAAAPAAPAAAAVSEADLIGPAMPEAALRSLVLGNTLYRPLADGARTLIYVAPDGAMHVRVSDPGDREVAARTGTMSLAGSRMCWRFTAAPGASVPAPACFDAHWNGRLLTLASDDRAILPAQFLVEQGNHWNL